MFDRDMDSIYYHFHNHHEFRIYATYRGIYDRDEALMKCLTLILFLSCVYPFNPINAVTASKWISMDMFPGLTNITIRLPDSTGYANLIDGDDAIIALGGGVRWTFNLDLDRQVYGYSYTSPLNSTILQ